MGSRPTAPEGHPLSHIPALRPDGTLTDTGPLFALVDPQDQSDHFTRCTALLAVLDTPLITTWPCLAEVMHLTGREDAWGMQQFIAGYIVPDMLRLHTPTRQETTRIFSIDGDFYIYRVEDGTALEALPGPKTTKRGRL